MSGPTRRLLFVSYYYPPLGGPGAFRPLHIAKYVPHCGWEIVIVSVRSNIRVLKDTSLMPEVPGDVPVERTRTLEPRNLMIALNRLGLGALTRRLGPLFMIPDEQRGWAPFAVRRAAALHRRRPFDVMLTTSAPYSAHLAGLVLRRQLGIPWVADFTDEWTTNPYLVDRYPTSWHRRLNQRLEQQVLRGADRVVAVSDPWRDIMHSLAPDLPCERFRTVHNGYDGAHFPPEPPPLPDRFRIVYTGMFYGHRSPRYFLEALRRVLADGRLPERDVDVVFLGHTGWGAELGAPLPCVQVHEYRPYFETLRLSHDAAVLLLVIPREGGIGNHSGKLFPYLASGRPILALAPAGNVAAELVRDSRSGVVAPPDDPAAIADAIVALYQQWVRREGLPRQDRQLIARFDARNLAREWCAIFDELVAERSGDSYR